MGSLITSNFQYWPDIRVSNWNSRKFEEFIQSIFIISRKRKRVFFSAILLAQVFWEQITTQFTLAEGSQVHLRCHKIECLESNCVSICRISLETTFHIWCVFLSVIYTISSCFVWSALSKRARCWNAPASRPLRRRTSSILIRELRWTSIARHLLVPACPMDNFGSRHCSGKLGKSWREFLGARYCQQLQIEALVENLRLVGNLKSAAP